MQKNKYISLIYLFCGALAWLILREVFALIFRLARLRLPVDWIVAPYDIIAVACGVVTAVILWKNKKVTVFTNEVVDELSRVVWPVPKETALSTGVVSVLVGICAVLLFGFDMLWGMVVRIFYK